ncbi:hypothetical protein SCD_n03124 (plasmid) [Sulfuricella denitrificans skB26]|uniref:Uncharacterized protein n=1 Tax=Sulfuricella denitrificans (strain DSM 22764 / NBRC 105220 / skB26) TaxID=1163617 RepID=S6AE50_SULDS|nr:hypothetical protein SCD_n03124 [Sulfuricella denitrificans skB26]
MVVVSLFCYACTRRYPAGTPGEVIKDAKGNGRWCCEKCASAKREAAKRKKSPSQSPKNS